MRLIALNETDSSRANPFSREKRFGRTRGSRPPDPEKQTGASREETRDEITWQQYVDKTPGGWTGKSIGGTLGDRLEGVDGPAEFVVRTPRRWNPSPETLTLEIHPGLETAVPAVFHASGTAARRPGK